MKTPTHVKHPSGPSGCEFGTDDRELQPTRSSGEATTASRPTPSPTLPTRPIPSHNFGNTHTRCRTPTAAPTLPHPHCRTTPHSPVVLCVQVWQLVLRLLGLVVPQEEASQRVLHALAHLHQVEQNVLRGRLLLRHTHAERKPQNIMTRYRTHTQGTAVVGETPRGEGGSTTRTPPSSI